MESYKSEFIDFLIECEALRFGDFTTKSGRRTPYFVNLGCFDTGGRLARLGEFYARALADHFSDGFDLLYGPAYKGIPLAAAAAIACSRLQNRDLPFVFNRKEAKDHGEGGALIGRQPRPGDRVIIIEDVTTAGTSVRETAAILKAWPGARLTGLLVAVDRREKGPAGRSAFAELRDEFSLRTHAIVTLDDIIERLRDSARPLKFDKLDELLQRIEAYRREFGADD